jgi:hypothetical protein
VSKKFFVIADVHSFYDEMQVALNTAKFDIGNPDHVLISCGDALDRGPKSMEVLEFLMSVPKERRIFIRGNHEDLLEDCIKRRGFVLQDLSNGTLKTIFNLCGYEESVFYDELPDKPEWRYTNVFDEIKQVKLLWDYLAECVDFCEFGKYVFVHSWFPTTSLNWRKANKEEWSSARWGNPFELWRIGYRIPKRTVVCGHWHTSYAHSVLHQHGTEFGDKACFDIFVDKGIVGLDACTVYSHKCNCLVIEE